MRTGERVQISSVKVKVTANCMFAMPGSEPTDFFHVEDSYSPAIHNIQNTLIFRLCNPEATLPPVPPILTKYMDPPPQVAARAEGVARKVKEVCSVKIGESLPSELALRRSLTDKSQRNQFRQSCKRLPSEPRTLPPRERTTESTTLLCSGLRKLANSTRVLRPPLPPSRMPLSSPERHLPNPLHRRARRSRAATAMTFVAPKMRW